MVKKAFQVVLTFALLVGGYQAYLFGFDVLLGFVKDRIPGGGGSLADGAHTPRPESETSKEATRLARESFGVDHPLAQDDLKIRVYDAVGGYYMYARDFKRLDNGKRFIFYKFGVISFSKDSRNPVRKTLLCDQAEIELNEAVGVLKPNSDGTHVVEAKLTGNIILRDDKGTINDRRDDLTVTGRDGPLADMKYTEKTDKPEITSQSAIHLIDRDMDVTGVGLRIVMRKQPPGSPGGFQAETAILKNEVVIVAKNAGRSGVLPGTAKGTPEGGATPMRLTAGDMRIDLPPKPRPLPPGAVGPPELEGPTIATFRVNVEAMRGVVLPDVLNCDTLRLTFLPMEKPPAFEFAKLGSAMHLGLGVAAPGAGTGTFGFGRDPSEGPLTELALREANAKGYAVWLRSTAQNITARCNELFYKKLLPASPDVTYLRADSTRLLFVEKLDTAAPEPNPGPVTSVTTLWAPDATIFDDGQGGAASTVVCRGPGRLETRPARDKSVEQSAFWNERLTMWTLRDPASTGSKSSDAKDKDPGSRRRILLTGDPKMFDHTQDMKLEAHRDIDVYLRPRPAEVKDKDEAATKTTTLAAKAEPAASATATATTTTQAKPGLGGGAFRVEHLKAREMVVLTAPGKSVRARDVLDAPFQDVVADPAAPAKVAETKPGSAPPARTTIAAVPAIPVPGAANPAPNAVAANAADDAPKPAPEPAVQVSAHRVNATMRPVAGQENKFEIAHADLRGDVQVHQDPSATDPRGTDAKGEALYLETVGRGLMKFRLFNADPSALAPGARLAARGNSNTRPVAPPAPAPAEIDTRDFSVRGPVIELDQRRDYARVIGPGTFKQIAERGFLSERGVVARRQALLLMKEADRKAELAKKQPIVITWTEQMQFTGQSRDPSGRPAGKAEFRGDVVARMEDGLISADDMDTYTDRPVSLVQTTKEKKPGVGAGAVNAEDVPLAGAKLDAANAAKPDEPKPELVLIDAWDRATPKGARAVVKHVGANGAERKGVLVTSIRTDKDSGDLVERQRLEGQRVIYDKRSGEYSVAGPGLVRLWKRTEVKPEAVAAGRPRNSRPPAALVADAGKTYTWGLTKVGFTRLMRGRFGMASELDRGEPRTADFYENVQAIDAPVTKDNYDVLFENRPPKTKFLTSQSLRLIDVPAPAGSPKGTPSRTLMTADANAQAKDDVNVVAGDWMTFDSEKSLFNAYGEAGRYASVTQQSNPGQPSSTTRGTAVEYNSKTGEAKIVDPTTIQVVEILTNVNARPGAEGAPGGPGLGPFRKRLPLRPPPLGNQERKGFGGGR